jgi:hypothetical protein
MRTFILISLMFIASQADAASGLPFLRLNSGARAAAMGEAAVALPDDEAIAANPSLLGLKRTGTLGLSHNQWIQDIRHEYLTLVFGQGQGTFGLAAQISRADGLERRTGPSVQPLGEFGIYNAVFNAAYAHSWGTNLRVGTNLKIIRQTVFTRSANGAAVDLGGTYHLNGDWRLAAAARNLGAMAALDQQATELPRAFNAGLVYSGLSAVLLSAELRHTNGFGATWHMGGEYAWNRMLFLRGGYQKGDTRDWSLGVGLQTLMWSVDYAFVPFSEDLGEAHRLSLHLHRRPTVKEMP